MQTAELARADGFIAAGDAEASYLVEVISPVNGKAQMPKDADPLSAEEIAVIREWIDAGATWPAGFQLKEPAVSDLQWWSLRPLERPEIPSIWKSRDEQRDERNVRGEIPRQLPLRTPIDAFIQQKLQEKGLQPVPPADARTLIRRLFFDLIGLPPTPDEVDAFVCDPSPQAYERLVDRLLDSPHYGERWARHWLDVVHYADTHGYDKDQPRPNAWPYRDYVIRSFNDDKPYSRFVQEQVAGDALWPDTVDGITAMGFIAAGPWDLIGHAEVPESKIDGKTARNLDRDDMVSSTLNTFCSVTVQCARCHNHKFDPVTQVHYYSLQAVFAALDRADRAYDPNPKTAARRAELKRKNAELLAERETLETEVARVAGEQLSQLDEELAELNRQKEAAAGAKPEFGYHSQIASDPDVEKWVQVDLGRSVPIASVTIVGCHDDFNGIGSGFGFPVRYRIEASNDAGLQSDCTRLADHTGNDLPNPGTDPVTATAPEGLTARYVRVSATKLAPRANDYIFALAELIVQTPEGDNVALGRTVTALDSIEAPVRWQRSNLVDGYYVGVDGPAQLGSKITEVQQKRKALLDRVLSAAVKARVEANQAALQATTEALAALPKQSLVYVGTVYQGTGAFAGTGGNGGRPRTIHLLHRGNVLSPGKEVGPGTIPVIAGIDWRFNLPEGHLESDRRVALAEWLTRRDHPLTWRSIVNRVWQYHFGRGIVDSPNDFGRMGNLPSHPELLDWLAVEFRDGGQSLKKLHRLIVTSSVYRQASQHDQRNSEIDSENIFLWRMNRRRLSAEEIRDTVLFVSGKLDRTMYGPGFQLFVVDRPEHSPHYEYNKHDPDDPESHRRSIYRFIVRSQPDPFMTTLDCADSSQSVAKRDETTTALQALSLLNNRFVLRMAEHFADRLQESTDDLQRQVEDGFRLVTGRRPTPDEQMMLVSYAERFGGDNLCRLLLNLNELMFVD